MQVLALYLANCLHQFYIKIVLKNLITNKDVKEIKVQGVCGELKAKRKVYQVRQISGICFEIICSNLKMNLCQRT